ncbi:MAG: hypothetical protein DPW14_07680 [Planctomycetes bacterium]|nr:hypothetical protein [Planctomycetota bacterium]
MGFDLAALCCLPHSIGQRRSGLASALGGPLKALLHGFTEGGNVVQTQIEILVFFLENLALMRCIVVLGRRNAGHWESRGQR